MVMEIGLKVKDQLRNCSSMATFESTDLATFRCNLNKAIQETIAAIELVAIDGSESSGNFLVAISTVSRLYDTVGVCIQWTKLCKAHDKKVNTFATSSTGRQYSSALQEVCCLLRNPSVIPTVYAAPLFVVLLRTLLVKPKSNGKWKPSELVLLQTMSTVVAKRIPSVAALLAPILEDYQASTLLVVSDDATTILESVNADRLHKFISVLSHVAIVSTASTGENAVWFQCTCVRLFLKLAQALDNADLELLLQKYQAELTSGIAAVAGDAPKEMCLHCQKRILPLAMPHMRRRGVNIMKLLDDDEEEVKPVSSRKMDSTMVAPTNQCRCAHSVRQPLSKASQFTQLPFSFVTLRSRACEQSLYLILTASAATSNRVGKRRTDRTAVSAAHIFARLNCGLTLGAARVLKTLLDMVLLCDHNETAGPSPSMRLSLLLAADSIGTPKALEYIFRHIWRQIDDCATTRANTEKVVRLLRVWSEILVESSYFDDADCCWIAMQPLLTRILSYCADDDDDEAEADKGIGKVKLDEQIYPLLRSLSYILSRRRPTLTADSKAMGVQFHDFITRVSISFGELSHWISSDMIEAEVLETFRTLQNVGILGLPVSYNADTSENDGMHSEDCNRGCCDWPFLEGIRGAKQRMGPRISRTEVLSEPNDANELATLFLQSLLANSARDAAEKVKRDAVPITDYLNDDNLRSVLSYLNPVDLVRFGSVNPICRTLAQEDVRWKQVYCSTYGILGDDVEAVVAKIGSWRNMFVEKYYSEKALKFKYTSTGFKHRTCGYVGCYQVVKSPGQQEKHYAVHEKRIEIKKKRLLATKKRQAEHDAKRNAAALVADRRQKELQKKKEAAEKKKELAQRRRDVVQQKKEAARKRREASMQKKALATGQGKAKRQKIVKSDPVIDIDDKAVV